MAQDNWWANDAPVGQTPPPATGGPVLGPRMKPDNPTPYQVEDQQFQRDREAQRKLEWDATHNPDGSEKPKVVTDGKPTEYQMKSNQFYGRMLTAENQYRTVPLRSRDARTGLGQAFHEFAPSLDATFNSSDRVTADNSARDWIAASLRQESGANITPAEYDNQYRIFFPMPGDTDVQRKEKELKRKQAMLGFKTSAGQLAADAEKQYQDAFGPVMPWDMGASGDTPPPADGTTPPAGGDGQPFTIKTIPGQEAPLPVGDMSGMQQVATGATRNAGAPEIENRVNQMWLQGRSMDEINGFLSANGYEQTLVSPNAAEAKYWRRKGEGPFQLNRQVPNEGRSRAAASPLGSYAGGAADAMSFGFSDELAGAAAAATGGDYTQARDRFRGNTQAMAELNPMSSLAGNISGGLLAGPAGRIAGLQLAPNATRAAGAAMAANPVATSVGMGATYGAGSTNENRLTGAVLGGAFGGAVGKVLQAATPPIANALTKFEERRQAARVIPNAPEVAAAGQAEDVIVNRAMVDPRVENKVTGVDASLVGGPKFQAGMREIEGQIEGRVNALGRDGTAMESTAAGQTYQAAGERFIKDSGKAAAAKYARAERLAGDAKVAPQQSLQAVDDALARLNETPSVNAAEIAFLKSLKSDLSKDLSVGGLRRMRTSLRKKISSGGLVFGEDEARVLGIMDAAATDIRNGLQAQGKGKAAKAFDLADKEYRGRMEFINGTLQKVIGKRGSNLSAETVAKNLNGMLRGRDSEGARAFLSKLTPEEHADFGATLANSLGRSSPDEPFSVATFLRHTKEAAFPPAALKVAFGEEGAQSIQNLRVLGKEVKRVTSAMNSRKSGSGVAMDWKSWLTNVVIGGAGGASTGSIPAAVAGAVAPVAVKGVREAITARMLLNPKITRWVQTAPRTTDPAVINSHIGRLESMSRAGTIGRMDAQAIQDYLRAAVGQSPGRAAAEDEGN